MPAHVLPVAAYIPSGGRLLAKLALGGQGDSRTVPLRISEGHAVQLVDLFQSISQLVGQSIRQTINHLNCYDLSCAFSGSPQGGELMNQCFQGNGYD